MRDILNPVYLWCSFSYIGHHHNNRASSLKTKLWRTDSIEGICTIIKEEMERIDKALKDNICASSPSAATPEQPEEPLINPTQAGYYTQLLLAWAILHQCGAIAPGLSYDSTDLRKTEEDTLQTFEYS